MSDSRMIVVSPGLTDAVKRETSHIIANGYLNKTIFVFAQSNRMNSEYASDFKGLFPVLGSEGIERFFVNIRAMYMIDNEPVVIYCKGDHMINYEYIISQYIESSGISAPI